VADRLRGQLVFPGEVDGSQRAPPIEASRYRTQVKRAEVSLDSSTIRSRVVHQKGCFMSTAAALRGIGRQLDDLAAIDDLLTEAPTLLALGEPTHGIKAFPLLRNELLAHLVEHGY